MDSRQLAPIEVPLLSSCLDKVRNKLEDPSSKNTQALITLKANDLVL
jgi:hypothetical protein